MWQITNRVGPHYKIALSLIYMLHCLIRAALPRSQHFCVLEDLAEVCVCISAPVAPVMTASQRHSYFYQSLLRKVTELTSPC